MYAKVKITGKITSETGMHIGGSDAFAAIGAVDSPVIRDVFSNYPMIPGSSLKGKLRTLIAREFNNNPFDTIDKDVPRIVRLFGAGGKNIEKSRLIFWDSVMENAKELNAMNVSTTEVKFENTINRASGVAMPRQIERSVRGAVFPLKIIYNVDNESEMEEDFQTLRTGLTLLEYDYLGGHGSRGYGKVKFSELKVEPVFGDVNPELLKKCVTFLEGE